jgi:hypothetical protein
MILPSKHLHQDRALLTVGAQVLKRLDRPKTVSALWEELCRGEASQPHAAPRINYEWFVLALDLLYLIGAVYLKHGLVSRESQ